MKQSSPMRWELFFMPLHNAYDKVLACLGRFPTRTNIGFFERVEVPMESIKLIIKEKVNPRLP